MSKTLYKAEIYTEDLGYAIDIYDLDEFGNQMLVDRVTVNEITMELGG